MPLLHGVMYRGSSEMMRLLVAHGANVDRRDHNGRTPLSTAAYEKNTLMVELLLELGAAVDTEDDQGCTPLRRIVDTLLDDYQDAIPTISQLVAAGAEMVASGALHAAAVFADEEALRVMVDAGADVAIVYMGKKMLTADLPLGLTAREYFDRRCGRRSGRELVRLPDQFVYNHKIYERTFGLDGRLESRIIELLTPNNIE